MKKSRKHMIESKPPGMTSPRGHGMIPLKSVKSPSLGGKEAAPKGGGMGKMPKMSMPKKMRGSTADMNMLKRTPYRD
jgi:hypothetical protein